MIVAKNNFRAVARSSIPWNCRQNKTISELLAFYMGKNTEERQQFIIKNLRVEADIVEGDADEANLVGVAA